jgi:ribonuclease III
MLIGGKSGKVGVGKFSVKSTQKEPLRSPVTNHREVWDDYSKVNDTPKKKVFEKGSGNRMVPSQLSQKQVGLKNTKQVEESEESANYTPRSDYKILEEKLSVEFNDISLLSRALTHRSALGIKERSDYERLEFLGDAVLDLSVAHLLSDLYPDAREGDLSKMRSALVNTQALADIARRLEISPYIRLGRGEFSSGGAERPSILADVMEAVIGAVYRDSSYETALKMIERIFGDALKEVTPFDPKTELQEALHAAGSEPPEYLLELVEGPEHAPTFVTVVVVDGEVVGRGKGATKKAAQQEAAAKALAKLSWGTKEVELIENQNIVVTGGLLFSSLLQKNGAK